MADRIRFLRDARGSPDGRGEVVLTFEQGEVARVPEDCPRQLAELFAREDQPTRRAEWVDEGLAGSPSEGSLGKPAETKLDPDDFTDAALSLAREHDLTYDDLGEPSGQRGDYLKSDVSEALE